MYQNSTLLNIFWLLVAALLISGVRFIDEPEPRPIDLEDNATWKEDPTQTPAYPQDSDLIEFRVDTYDSTPLRYFIDAKSLTVGATDEVVRYTIVIQSSSGARNVAFEGLHCNTATYKTYAIGTAENHFQNLKNSNWIAIKRNAQYRYHWELRELYFCQTEMGYRPYEISDILHRLDNKAYNSTIELF